MSQFWTKFLSIRFSFHDQMMCMMHQSVQSRISHDWIWKQRNPILGRPIAGNNDRRLQMTLSDDLIKIFCLSGGERREGEVIEGKLRVDHVHVLLSIPPKYSVSQVVGYMKGKSAIWVARTTGRNRNFVGQHFWARGYYVSSVGLDEEAIREYVRTQEEADEKLDQLKMFE